MKYDIFISYRRADRELVASVVRRLEARGVGVWYDAKLEGGSDWREEIVEALTNADMLAIFFSDDCNNSRQIKKELAIADSLAKPVVPILIENTQPRGAYLYELANRNWIQAWPDPMDRVDELVEHLATLAGKSDGGLAGAPPMKAASPADTASMPAAANDGIPAPAANDDAQEQPLIAAVGEFIEGANTPPREAPRVAKAYVGRVVPGGKPARKLNDILPFRWIDLVFLVPLLGAGAFFLSTQYASESDAFSIAATGLVLTAVVAAYGALVFPVRYYLRGRAPLPALGSYLLSSAIIYIVFGVVYLTLRFSTDIFQGEDPVQVMLSFAAMWGVFTLFAFMIYGALSGQRAIRSFRSNIRKL